jgi:hypothetical protein
MNPKVNTVKVFPIIYTLAFFLFPLTVKALSPQDKCPLMDHLIEINRSWLLQENASDFLYQESSFLSDIDRIQMHLQLVHQLLQSKSTTHLNGPQIDNRLLLLHQLQGYAAQKVFPVNSFHAHRQPYFMDTQGTACAVGHLLLENGQSDFALQISRENNFAYISELATYYPQLATWAKQYGFTVEELAWIQPGYFPPYQPFLPLANDGGVNGSVNVMITNPDESLLFVAGLFDSVDGTPANNIIAWDGFNWSALANGVNGEIHTMEFFDNKLFVGGNFSLFENPEAKNIAYWDGSNWYGLQEGDMGGTVYALKFYWFDLFAGGDFELVSGDTLPYLAYYDYNDSQTWKNSAQPQLADEIPNATEVNGPVRCLEEVGANLLVGGDFTLTAPNVTETQVNSIDAHYLAYWNRYGYWAGALYGSHNPVHTLGYINGDIFIGGDISEDIGFSLYQAGLWFNEGQYGSIFWQFQYNSTSDSTIRQFIPFEDKVLILGGFYYWSGAAVQGNGAAIYHLEITPNQDYIHTLRGFARFDNTVKAAVHFQNQLIFAGDFERVNSIDVNNFALLDLSTPVQEINTHTPAVKVYMDAASLHIQYEELAQEAQLNLYNIQGQLCSAILLPQGSNNCSQIVAQLPRGTYVYQIVNPSFQQTGKLIK